MILYTFNKAILNHHQQYIRIISMDCNWVNKNTMRIVMTHVTFHSRLFIDTIIFTSFSLFFCFFSRLRWLAASYLRYYSQWMYHIRMLPFFRSFFWIKVLLKMEFRFVEFFFQWDLKSPTNCKEETLKYVLFEVSLFIWTKSVVNNFRGQYKESNVTILMGILH